MRPTSTVTLPLLRWRRGAPPHRETDELAVEEPLEIQVDTRPIVVTMRTPGHDPELAAGFLVTEGLIRQRSDVREIKLHPRNKDGNVLQVFLSADVTIDFAQLTRHVFASSSCGLCGKASIEAVHRHFKRIRTRGKFPAAMLLPACAKLRAGQSTFDRTGGLHAAGIFDARGNLIVLREDVGRHNAVDKVLGFCFLDEHLPLDRHVLLVSGRASFEILQKALAARIPVVAAVSAPSSLAVRFAENSGITLVGFLRDDRMKVYTHPNRLTW
jgi:FdhD protein